MQCLRFDCCLGRAQSTVRSVLYLLLLLSLFKIEMINVQAFVVDILWRGGLGPLENGTSSEGTQFLWKKRNGSFRGGWFLSGLVPFSGGFSLFF